MTPGPYAPQRLPCRRLLPALLCGAVLALGAAGAPMAPPEQPGAAVGPLRDVLVESAGALAAFVGRAETVALGETQGAPLLDAYVVRMLSVALKAEGVRAEPFPARLLGPVRESRAPLPPALLKALRNKSVATFVHLTALTDGGDRQLVAAVYDVGSGRCTLSLRKPFGLSQEMASLLARPTRRMEPADASWLELLDAMFDAPERGSAAALDVAEAQFMFESGLWEAAADRFEKLAPPGPDSRFLRVVMARQMAGQQEQAVRLTEQALRRHPDSGPLWALRSWLSLRAGQSGDALMWLEQARLSDMTREGLYRYAGGLTAWETGNEQEAERELKRAAVLLPAAAFVQLRAARFYRNRGRLEEAIVYYERALKGADATAATWAEMAVALQAVGEESRALKALERAFALRSDNVVVSRRLAALLRRRGRYDDALDMLRRAADANPQDPAVLSAYGDEAARTWRLDDARQAYESAVELGADYPYARVRLAAVLAAQQQYRPARRLLTALLATRPDYQPARIELGRIRGELGLLDQAVSLLEDAAVSAEYETAARRALATVYLNAGDAQKAIDCAQIAAQSGDDAETYAILSSALLAAGDLDKAEDAARAAIARDDRSAEAHLAMARVLRARGKSEEASAQATRALACNPYCVEALRTAGFIALDAGDFVRCAELWQRALALNPWHAQLHRDLSDVLGPKLGNWTATQEHLLKYVELEAKRQEGAR